MGINFFNLNDRDARFVLFEHLEVDKLVEYEAFNDFTRDSFKKTVNLTIKEALKVCREVMGPTLQDGDQEGCKFEKGIVTLPESFPNCWKVLSDNDWIALANNPEFGGQGLPMVVAAIVEEFFYGANPSMMIYAGLSVGSARLIESFGTDEDRNLFVENMYTGVWGGTMCLTESDAGSDVGNVLTAAEKDPGSDDPSIYLIEGNKQYISGGDQNMTDNIIHLVLARIKGAPEGTRGLSLFIVPKIWVNPDGSLGEQNDVACTGVEHKMGVNGQATCSMSFGQSGKCRGILLGEPQTGIAKMFQLMNEYRMFTGAQALGQASCAYGVARKYAKERVQGPLYTNPRGGRVRLVEHEDIRRMLMNQKAGTEAMRAMTAKAFYMIDVALNDPDEATRVKFEKRFDLLIPMVKAYCTDFSCQLIRDAIQIMGGVGYCREFPVEQYARDCKITTIVEGTNYIQSRDLVGRKLTMDNGKVFSDFILEIIAFAEKNRGDSDFAVDIDLLLEAAEAVKEMAGKITGLSKEEDLRLVPLFATRFLECSSEVFMAQLMLEQGMIARKKMKEIKEGGSDALFYRGKIETARYFCRNILTNVFGRYKTFMLEDSSALNIPEEVF